MNSRIGGAFPTTEQEELLKAALWKGEAATQAWRAWSMRGITDQTLDWGSYRLLPLLYHNLQALGVQDAWTIRLKNAYQLEWCKNQLLLHTATDILRHLHAEGIETLVLKGAALSFLYYRDQGLRPMGDFDLLVRPAHRRAAIDILMRDGWKPMARSLEELGDQVLDTQQAWIFEKAGKFHIDLHWNVMIQWRPPGADDDLWTSAVPVELEDVTALALNPTDQLLHACIHGIASSPIPSPTWVADAWVILDSSLSEIDWSRLVAQARKRRVVLPLREALLYLRDVFGAAIPDHVLTELSSLHVSHLERDVYRAATAKATVLGGLPLAWYRHRLDLDMDGKANWMRSLIGYPSYLRRSTAFNYWHLVRWLVSRAAKRLGKSVRGMEQE